MKTLNEKHSPLPREWYLNFGTTLGVSVRTPSQFTQTDFPRSSDFQEDAIRVIEYSAYSDLKAILPELIEQLERYSQFYHGSKDADLLSKTNELIKRAKGSA